MDFANGTVKKYSREYTRTLKNGKKKKYKTEQVQVTVPKAENIFEDAEEVIILRKEDFYNLENNNDEDIEEIEEIMTALELFNLILTENIQDLESELEDNKSELDKTKSDFEESLSKIGVLEAELDESKEELENNKSMIDDFKSQIEDLDSGEDLSELQSQLDSKDELIDDLNDKIVCYKEELESKDLTISNLKDDLNNLYDESIASAEGNNNFDDNDYVALQKDFIRLSKKYELIQEELFNVKVNAMYHKNLANKYRKFILNLK